jgi:ubiquinone biosynthesis protein UbiJ
VTAAAEFFSALPARLSAADESAGPAVIAFALDGAPSGGWTLRLSGDDAALEPGVAAADVTVTCALEQWERIVAGELSPQTAWATGRLSVSGDMRLAQRVRSLLAF